MNLLNLPTIFTRYLRPLFDSDVHFYYQAEVGPKINIKVNKLFSNIDENTKTDIQFVSQNNNLQISTTIDKKIAAGGTSSVYVGKWHRTSVAIKKFEVQVVDFLEIELLK